MKSRVRPNGASQANAAPFCFGPVSTAQSLNKAGVKCAEKLLGRALVTSAGVVGLSCEQQGEHLRR